MTVADVLALQPGDVLRLDGQASHGVTIFADQVPVHRARPGRSGTKRAAQILGPVEDVR
jgi:flagellar motor switch protein FliM